MKRPAERPPEGDERTGAGPPEPPPPGNNPFAGISLFSAAPSGGSFFAAATDSTIGSGFAPAAVTAVPSVAPSASAPPADNSKPANPFMGLSLFSPPSSGGLFSSAVNSLSRGANTDSTASFAAADTALAGAGSAPVPAAPTAGLATAAAAPAAATAATAPAPAAAVEAQHDGSGGEEPEEPPQDAGEAGEPTGEEDDEVIFRAECKLWKLVRHAPTPVRKVCAEGTSAEEAVHREDAGGEAAAPAGEKAGWHWQERGCGILHVNRHGKTGAGRLVMRMRGVLKLLLNTPVFPTTKYERVGQKSVRFVGVDVEAVSAPKEGEVSLCAYRLNLQSGDQQSKFLTVLKDLLGASMAA